MATRCRSGTDVRSEIDKVRVAVNGMAVTTVAQTVLDVAASTSDLVLVRKLLVEIEYQTGALNADRLRVVCGRGRRGSVRLTQGLEAYDPRAGRGARRRRQPPNLGTASA